MKLRISRGEEVLSDLEVGEGEYVIGSGESAQLRIESDFIAPEHARLRIGTGGVEVEDLGSGRETWIGELALVGAQPLAKGSILQFGDIALQVYDAEISSVLAETDAVSRRYMIGAVVATGAMGVIHSAREVHTGREVAMKQIRPGIDDSVLVSRFVQEAKITAHLEHPNVVPVHDVNLCADGARFYTMKMVRGVSLEKLLELLVLGAEATLKKYPLDALLTIFQKICDAVAFAHSKGVIHRDLKPANIMVGAYGEVLVMDWGLAKLLGEETTELSASDLHGGAEATGNATQSGMVLGTPHYMAPEQASGDIGFVDARSDVYCLGAILYQILTLQTPTEGKSAGEVLQKVRAGMIIPPLKRIGAKILPHLPSGKIPVSLAAVATKALSFSPERRYQHVPDLQAEIRAYQSGFATAAEDASASRQFTLFIRRHRAVSIATAAGLMVVALTSSLYTASVIHERDRTEVQRKRADAALAELHETSPDFAAKAQGLLALGDFDAALKNFNFAIAAGPENTAYRLERADLLQATGRLAEAIPEYERVLEERPGDQKVQSRLAISRELLSENEGKPKLRPELQQRLAAALDAEGRNRAQPLRVTSSNQPVVVLSVVHRVDLPDPEKHQFYSNGNIDWPNSNVHQWSIQGNQLIMKWGVSKSKPDGGAIDRCTISADRRSYRGTNQSGHRISGDISMSRN